MAEQIAVGGVELRIENRRVGQDGGPSMRVMGEVEGEQVQLLRFDMFEKRPHYHYAPDGENTEFTLDPLTHDDGIGWVVTQLRDKLPALIKKAGYDTLAESVDHEAVAAALPGVESQWRAM